MTTAPAPVPSPAPADPYAKQREKWAAEIGKVDWLFDVDAALAKAKAAGHHVIAVID